MTDVVSIHDMPSVDYFGVSLAPMAGYSDMPFRRICRRYGSALSYTEFVSTDAVVRENVRTLQMLRFAEDERPVIFQIFGYDADTIVEAALRLEALRPDGIDLNLGCSVPKVAHKGSGAALLQNPEKIVSIIEAMVKRLRVPVSAKMRIGWNDSGQAVDIARRIEDAGASMLAIHGRTAEQRYTGRADWSVIGAIRDAVKIPLLGNGDIESLADAEEKMRRYGVDGVLIGRAAHGNPWIFQSAANPLTARELCSVFAEHLQAMLHFHGEQGLFRFRKHALQYARHVDLSGEGRKALLSADSVDQLIDAFHRIVSDRTDIASPSRLTSEEIPEYCAL